MPLTLQQIDACFPTDHSRQVDAYYYLDKVPPVENGRLRLFVDLGAGTGSSVDLVRKTLPNTRWVGLDIADSPVVRKRRRTDCEFVTYNRVDLPFEDVTVDVVYSRQVFEHVRHPEPLLRDITRVLRPGGLFIGSVSQLEPFHSYSFWNFTFYGFATVAHDAALTLK